jgi:hypothetical protein
MLQVRQQLLISLNAAGQGCQLLPELLLQRMHGRALCCCLIPAEGLRRWLA